jgi:cytidylate kinase
MTEILDLPHIAIVGKAGAGKTTGAEILCGRLGYNRASFAAILKDVARLIWGADATKDRGKLQKLGVAVRDIQEDAWVNALLRQIESWRGPIVIDDCRFPNEYWALKHMGFKFIRVRADEPVRQDRLMRNGKFTSHEQMNHISETALDDIDMDLGLFNNGSGESYEAELLSLVERLRLAVV